MSRKIIVGPDAVCKHGHVGQYRLTSRGWAQCGQCYRELRRRRYQRPEVREGDIKYAKDNYPRIKENMKKRRKAPAEKVKEKARIAVWRKVKLGEINKETCRDCAAVKVDFHHTNGYDENNWFTGVWLCRKHHAAEHVRVRELKVRKALK